jgi:hypothetical protein
MACEVEIPNFVLDFIVAHPDAEIDIVVLGTSISETEPNLSIIVTWLKTFLLLQL